MVAGVSFTLDPWVVLEGIMLGTADRQGSLLGVDSLAAKLFEGDDDSFYARLAAHGDEIVRDEDFGHCYADGRGRPHPA